MRKIIVGSRKSELAIAQTEWVIDQLKSHQLPFEFEIKTILTKGDKILDVSLSKIGGKGLFVKEIEQALIRGEIDIAVHSMKDMPTVMPLGLIIGATTSREDARDALISDDKSMTIAKLPIGARIGTSSLRRSAQLLNIRPDLEIIPIRGNVGSRLKKIDEMKLDGIILACAGLYRLGQAECISEAIELSTCVPAVGQGALAVQCRDNDPEIQYMLSNINDYKTEVAITAERTFLKKLEGGCQVPIGAYATCDGTNITLTGMVATIDGKTVLKKTMTDTNPVILGLKLADVLQNAGAVEILKSFN